MLRKQNKGFTLLEILLVIATIGILAAIVLVAINPNRQLAQARNAQRRSDINTIYKALEQYLIDTGSYPNSINTNFKEICNTGSQKSTDTLNPTTLCDNKADLRALVPDYLAGIPTAPSGGIYRVARNGNNRIAVYTIGESSQTIAINFAVTNYGIIDVDAFNYITAIETADGQALEDNVKIAINNFVIGLKTDGIWEPIKASVIMAGARTLNGALVPLKGTAPTNFNFVSGDYNRKTGLVGNGSTKYLNSNRNNNADPQNSNHNAVYATNIGTTGAFMGANDPATGAGTGTNFISRTGFTRNRNPTGAASPATIAPGLFAMSRNASGSYTARVAQTNGTINDTSQVPFNSNIFVFQRPGTSSVVSVPTDARLAFYSIGESLNLALLDARVTQLITDYANAIP